MNTVRIEDLTDVPGNYKFVVSQNGLHHIRVVYQYFPLCGNKKIFEMESSREAPKNGICLSCFRKIHEYRNMVDVIDEG